MKVTIVGCGDAFGSGGRLQSSYHVQVAPTHPDPGHLDGIGVIV